MRFLAGPMRWGGAFAFVLGVNVRAGEMEIDPLWKSAGFRKSFTGSYGIDSRIEPKVSTGEKLVLDAVAKEMASGDRDGAAAKLAESTLLDQSAVLIFTLANIRFEQGGAEDAAEGFAAALKLYPNFRDAHRNLAVAEVQLGHVDEAEPHLRRALELGAQDGLTLGLLGYCHASAGRDQPALQAYRLAQLTMPDEVQWRIGEAGALLALDDLEAAGSIYESVLELRPEEASIWVNLADVRLRQGEAVKAIADLEVARRLGGLGAEEMISLGHAYLNESLVEAAMGCYEEGLSMEPAPGFAKAVDSVENLGRFGRWAEAGEIAGAMKKLEGYTAIFEGAEEKDGEEKARLERVLAMVELEIGDRDAGEKLVTGLLEKNPLDGQSLLLMAEFKRKGGGAEEAEMLLEQAARIPEFEGEALRKLGALLVDRGDFEAALKPLRRANDLAPDAALKAYLETVESLAGE